MVSSSRWAARRPVSYWSVWGLVRNDVMMLAWSTMRCVTLACGSSVTAMGTPGPTTARTRASSSPSASPWLTVNMAPCRASNTPSMCGCARRPSSSMAHMVSKAASATTPLGLAKAEMGTSIVQPYCSAAAMNAPISSRVPL